MDILTFKALVSDWNFVEYPTYIAGGPSELISELINYNDLEPDLKIYIAKLILCRSFSGNYMVWPQDVEWFINGFLAEYKGDPMKPWISNAIREAINMILANEGFTKGAIATTFMFGVLEYCAKFLLGFRPMEYNFFDDRKKEYVKQYVKRNDLAIKGTFEFLQKKSLPISDALNDIDAFTVKRLSDKGIPDTGWTPHKIADRLNLPRNTMLHGENHAFYNAGHYLVMLYALFCLT